MYVHYTLRITAHALSIKNTLISSVCIVTFFFFYTTWDIMYLVRSFWLIMVSRDGSTKSFFISFLLFIEIP